ncbi:murein L,D-transpeptidase catalytic domain family protein [Luteimonas kalidii]|uniref:Murein L,D-transpeptidase catalytic domain family protein n=1 Tax=Luteimonas kalidii TaxID=3042025 RepID=A0ABT6JX96_9GAMM|nr:murein L,D-transpeptidase catalytic domain family protein [Luteimonas kalidii]MDH5834561.1 murein L,D-transpeptidase catalytic domain family protein [Luteimonas kalidii]
MSLPRCLPLVLALVAALALASVPAARAAAPSVERLARAAPTLDREVLSLATRALACAMQDPDASRPATLSVIDYSLPSTEPRLWVFDLERERLLYRELVAHGRGTGDNLSTRFSNRSGSHMSSLGVFRTGESYVGINGYSLRLDGLEPGFNDLARERAIVIHGAPYVDDGIARAQGRLGRSLGCPAVRPAVARELIDRIRGGSLVFAYYPDPAWLQRSRLLADDCAAGAAADTAAGTP